MEYIFTLISDIEYHFGTFALIIFVFTILFLPSLSIYYVFDHLVYTIKNKRNKKAFKFIEKPNWEPVPTKEGTMVYKFKGFSNFDSKAKFLEIEKKNILNDSESLCWKLINSKIKINQYITILPKFPIKELITITDEDKLFRGWRQKMEPVIIDFLILDNELNPIAGIQFKRKSEFNKFVDDIFYNIRIPVFWLDKNQDTFEYQINDIFNRINDYFIQANLIENERKFSR